MTIDGVPDDYSPHGPTEYCRILMHHFVFNNYHLNAGLAQEVVRELDVALYAGQKYEILRVMEDDTAAKFIRKDRFGEDTAHLLDALITYSWECRGS